MTTDRRLITADELFEMSSDRGCELVRGEVIDTAPAGFDHGAVIGSLQRLISNSVYEQGIGVIAGAETGFTLFQDPDIVRGVDVGFVQKSQIPKSGRPKTYFDGAPDLAVGVLSPSDRSEAVDEKVDDYLKAGAVEVLVVSPERKTVTIYRKSENPIVLIKSNRLKDLRSLPGIECPIADIFA